MTQQTLKIDAELSGELLNEISLFSKKMKPIQVISRLNEYFVKYQKEVPLKHFVFKHPEMDFYTYAIGEGGSVEGNTLNGSKYWCIMSTAVLGPEGVLSTKEQVLEQFNKAFLNFLKTKNQHLESVIPKQ